VRSRGAAVGEEALLQRECQVLGEADADEAAGGDGVAVMDQCHRFGGADDLALGVALHAAPPFLPTAACSLDRLAAHANGTKGQALV
jgi:hypothetical protein